MYILRSIVLCSIRAAKYQPFVSLPLVEDGLSLMEDPTWMPKRTHSPDVISLSSDRQSVQEIISISSSSLCSISESNSSTASSESEIASSVSDVSSISCNFIEATIALTKARRATLLAEYDETKRLPEIILGMCILPFDKTQSRSLYDFLTVLNDEQQDARNPHHCVCPIFTDCSGDLLVDLYKYPVCPMLWPRNLFGYCLPCVYLPETDTELLRAQIAYLASPAQLDVVHFIKKIHIEIQNDPRLLCALAMFQFDGTPNSYKLTDILHGIFNHHDSFAEKFEIFVFNPGHREENFSGYELDIFGYIDEYITSRSFQRALTPES